MRCGGAGLRANPNTTALIAYRGMNVINTMSYVPVKSFTLPLKIGDTNKPTLWNTLMGPIRLANRLLPK